MNRNTLVMLFFFLGGVCVDRYFPRSYVDFLIPIGYLSMMFTYILTKKHD